MNVLRMLVLIALVSGCSVIPSAVKPALEDKGEVFVYFEPFPHEAGKLKFTIGSLSLVSGDGTEFLLSTALADFNSNTAQRQRFFAAGRIPPGKYRGLSCTITKATLAGEQGETALLVPEKPVEIPLSFEIQRKKAVVLSLKFQYAESIQSGVNFLPRLSLSIPSLPVSGLVGYVVNRDDNDVIVFDKKTGHVAAIIATDKRPFSIALDQNARIAYLSLEDEDAVDVIDVTDGVLTNRVSLRLGDGPREVALTPDGRFLLALNARSRTLSIIDPVALVELSRIPVGDGPRNLLVSRTGGRCFVFNGLANTISVIDIPNSAVVATISTKAGPLMGQFNRKGDRLYVVHEGGPYLSVFDPSTLSLVTTVFVGHGISFIKVDTMTDLMYAYRSGDRRLEVYDPFSLMSIDSIPATDGIVYMTIDGETNSLFLLSADKSRLFSVSLISRNVTAETDTGANPTWVTMMGER